MRRYLLLFAALFLSFCAFAAERLPYVVESGGIACDTIYTLPDVDALYPGGNDAMYDDFFKHLKPEHKLKDYMSSKILLVKILVDRDGNILQSKELRSFDPDYTADVISVIERFPLFSPAEWQGRKVCSYKIIKLYFE